MMPTQNENRAPCGNGDCDGCTLCDGDFTLDGEHVAIAAFLADNGWPTWSLEAQRIAALRPGESITYGGGAAATFVLRRLS